jgi:ribulose-bisphosphate carboxylase small chain
MFDFRDAKAIMGELAECRRMHGEVYIRLCGFASTHTWESLRMSLIVQRPTNEPGFMPARVEQGAEYRLRDPGLRNGEVRRVSLRLAL